MRDKLWLAAALCVATALGGCVTTEPRESAPCKPAIATGFINQSVQVHDKESRYVVYVPREYDPSRPWPLIVFLHGSGERGEDGLWQTDVGLGHAIRQWPERFPCLVLMPQCPKDILWDEDKAAMDIIDATLDKTLRDFNVDPDRIYLTGLSMGGFATWIYGAQHIDRYAALMPICGGGRTEDAKALAKVPIWVFHGADDDGIEPEESRRMVRAITAAGGTIKYTEFPNTKHDAWDPAYADPESIRWLLAQRRKH